MHENRETSGASRANRDRSGKANNHKPDRHAAEESDRGIVPMKRSNNDPGWSAENAEGRLRVKENTCLPCTRPTLSGDAACLRGRRGCGRRCAACCHHPRQEPYAVIPLVRICAGGGQQWPSLPRPRGQEVARNCGDAANATASTGTAGVKSWLAGCPSRTFCIPGPTSASPLPIRVKSRRR